MDNADLKKIYCPMTETAFYILLSLQVERHGYSIMQRVEEITGGRITIGPGTLYGTLSKMKSDELIELVRQEGKRKIYQATDLGKYLLQIEKERIAELYKNSERTD